MQPFWMNQACQRSKARKELLGLSKEAQLLPAVYKRACRGEKCNKPLSLFVLPVFEENN